MKWSEKCLQELVNHDLFENSDHQSRLKDLLDCYSDAPFFNKGLCKCMYLSAWDDEHFAVMLDVLNDMTIDRQDNLDIMKDQGELLEAEAERKEAVEAEGADLEIWKLSNAFVSGTVYDCSGLSELGKSDPDTAYIIRRALLAGDVIDSIDGNL